MFEPCIKELIEDRLFQPNFSKEDKIETLEFVKNFFRKVGYNPLQFNSDIEDVIHDIMLKEKICPYCHSELELHTWNEPRGEHFGYPVSEKMSEFKCRNCGWQEGIC